MSYRYDVRFAGEGGQGVVTGGLLLAEAAAVFEGKNVVMTQTYAAQQRGGPARAEVIISDEQIDYPKVLEADVLLALNQDAFDRYHHQMKRNGVIIVESARVGGEFSDHVTVLKIPMEEISGRVAGSKVGANFVALGVISGLKDIVSPTALRSAIKARHGRAESPANLKAFSAGVLLGKNMKMGKIVSPIELKQETHG
ncbi:MAG: 2-oxoacid:acceptor oxidoreductase family protein [Dehalococcoidia bacterium]|nr:2-oxoacid:acceptor oxidoreductase family protein [Dehalococcoidia bacterium]